MIKMFNYEVTTYAEGNEVVLRTNSIDDALSAIFQCAEDDLHANIINGHTGEVLAIVNHPDGEDFATDEMALMMVGFIASKNLGEPEENEPEDEPDLVSRVMKKVVEDLGLDGSLPLSFINLGGMPS